MNSQLDSLKKRTFETGLSNNFSGALDFGTDKGENKARKEIMATPSNIKARPNLGNSLTERLHRGTQASIKMGRRQVGTPGAYESYPRDLAVDNMQTPQYSARLGKRTFHQQMVEDEFYGQTPSMKRRAEDTPGLHRGPSFQQSDSIAARRMRKDSDLYYTPQQSLGLRQ